MKSITRSLLLAATLAACAPPPQVPVPEPQTPPIFTPHSGVVPMLNDSITPDQMAQRVAQFAPATLSYNAAILAPWEKQVLEKLVQASDVLNEIYRVQVHPRLPAWRAQLAAQEGAGKQAALEYFDIMAGPWDRLRDNQPFLEVGPMPPGGGFYPLDLSKQEFESYVAAHPAEKAALAGYFTVIKRDVTDRNKLTAIPYSQAYRPQLERAAILLREAAALSQNPSLADFLRKRADAFLSNAYYASDVAWMDITGSRIEPTIGPYEVYDDVLFGYKAAFESFITVADPAASAQLEGLKSHMRELEARLPMDDKYKNTNRSFQSPIRVVDLVYNSGEARNGIQTIAFNLPNDERVIAEKGSKKVMLRNVMQAKFDKILLPIAAVVLPAETTSQIAFQPWFSNVLMHELAHGLGPQGVNKTLKERHSALEEAKADVTGLHNIGVLAERGVYDDGSAKFSVDYDAYVKANRELATEILTIQATGDYDRAGRLIEKYGRTVPAALQQAIAGLSGVAVDINPVFQRR